MPFSYFSCLTAARRRTCCRSGRPPAAAHRICRRTSVPQRGRASAAELEAAGRELLETAARERREVEVTVALPFYAMPGELVELRRGERDSDGLWRVARSTVELDGDGIRTRMILREKDCVR